MKTSLRLGLTTALLFVPGTLAAQERIWEGCQNSGTVAYGSAVTLSDLDGDGDLEPVIGAPSLPFANLPGSVYFDSTFQVVIGDDPNDRFGAAVAGDLTLDADGGDVVAGAPGDDDNGAECGAVRALSDDRLVLYTIYGDAAGDELGTSVARIGDLDGDGFTDYLAGAPQTAAGGAGYVRVISGLFGTTIRTHTGAAPGDAFGRGLTGLPDLDGDTLPDYAIGAPHELGLGRVRVYSGLDGSLIRMHDGALAGDEFGFALGSWTDVDRDTVDELIVGAPRGGLAAGSAYAFSGASGVELLAVHGSVDDWRFGAAVCGTGDFDGDGHGDLGVGAPGGDFMGYPTEAGYVSVFSGDTGARLFKNGGGWSGSGAGIAVAGGDIDGDGLGDVLVGGFQNNDSYGASSCVSAFRRSGTQRVRRGADDTEFGKSVCGIGDLNGDGRREIVIGAPRAKDSQGNTTGSVRVETVDGELLWEFFGDSDGDRLGEAVASAGDVDLDGVDDILVGAASRNGFAPGAGYARIYSGATGLILHDLGGVLGSNSFGSALDGGVDVDDDGHPDVIVGGAAFSQNQGDLVGFLGTGKVRVFSGQTGAVLHTIDGFEAEGASVALLEDINGDGHGDFAFGIPERTVGAPFFTLGEIEVRSGADGALLGSFTTFYFRIGTALTAIDDMDGDGLQDLVVGSWDAGPLWSMGSVHGVSTGTFQELWMNENQVSYTGLTYGYALSGARDGSGALAIGSPGTNTSSARAVGSAQAGGTLQGYSGWDYLGYSVATLGDVNGDGAPDYAVGAPTEIGNSVGAEAGQNRVHLVLSLDLRSYNYCPQAINTSGSAATIAASGSSSLAQADLTLDVTDLPVQKPGAFLMGSNQTALPYFSGFLCVGGQVGRVSAPLPSGPLGEVSFDVDFATHPASFITPGSSWSFQFLVRDAGGMLNTSDAVRVDFLP